MTTKLHTYLFDNMIVHYLFARKCDKIMKERFGEKFDFCATTLNRILHGKCLPKLVQALSIEIATDGEVSLYDWVTADEGIYAGGKDKQHKSKKN
jgi:hypothetical protein